MIIGQKTGRRVITKKGETEKLVTLQLHFKRTMRGKGDEKSLVLQDFKRNCYDPPAAKQGYTDCGLAVR